MTPKEIFDKLRSLCKGTVAESAFEDAFPFAYMEGEYEKGGVKMTHITTGDSRSQHVIVVVASDGNVNAKSCYIGNYGGYYCWLAEDGLIHEKVGYGFGSWGEFVYDEHLRQLSQKSTRDYGSCCD